MKLKLSPDVQALNPAIGRSLAIDAEQREKKKARVPRAAADEATGLATLIIAGWCVQSPDAVRYRLYIPGLFDTGLCEDEKTACDRAKELRP